MTEIAPVLGLPRLWRLASYLPLPLCSCFELESCRCLAPTLKGKSNVVYKCVRFVCSGQHLCITFSGSKGYGKELYLQTLSGCTENVVMLDCNIIAFSFLNMNICDNDIDLCICF